MKKILIAILFFVPVVLVAQQVQQDTLASDNQQKKRIRILNSDITKSIESDSGTISRFRYNVRLEHEGVLMECDSAVLWPNGIFEAFGNTKVTSGTTIVAGDTMIYSELTGKAKVTGRIVYLTDGSSTLRTSQVDFDTETEIGYFEHEGTIVDSSRILESKRGYYYSKTKDFEFIGQVQSDTKEYVLQSDSMKYNTDTKIFIFHANTHIWSENGYLYCDRGWYDSDKAIMFFYRNSYMLSAKQEIFADSIYYENNDRKGQLYSNVQVVDTAQKTIALADFADFDMTTENFLMRKNPSIVLYDDKDSVFLRADTLYSVTKTLKIPVADDIVSSTRDTLIGAMLYPDTAFKTVVADTISKNVIRDTISKNIIRDTISKNVIHDTVSSVQDTLKYVDSTYKEMFAIRNAKLYRSDFQLKGDSLYFNTLDSIWKIYYDPILWDGKKMQITSDSMKFYIENGDLRHVDFNGNAMIVLPEGNPDSTTYFNQIKSKNMKAFLRDRKLNVFDALGNVQTLFFSLSNFTMNTTESAAFKMFFEDGKIRWVAYYTEVRGNNNPFNLVREDEIHLPGYRWEIDLRPQSGVEILNRPLRPSVRAVKNALSKPSFPVTKRIDEIESRIKNDKSQKK
jgi:lipopolysaccharide export system protein LptA